MIPIGQQVDIKHACNQTSVPETPKKNPRKELLNWIQPMNCVKVRPNQANDISMSQRNHYEILCEEEHNEQIQTDSYDMETIVSTDIMSEASETCKNKCVSMHELFAEPKKPDNTIINDTFPSDTGIDTNIIFPGNRQIQDLVNMWKKKAGSAEYHFATKQMSYLHRLTQLHVEIDQAIVTYKHIVFSDMQEEVEMLRLDIISANDELKFTRAALRCEEINCQFGNILCKLGHKQEKHVDTVQTVPVNVDSNKGNETVSPSDGPNPTGGG